MPKDARVQIITHAPPPPDLPVYQRVDPKEISFFGRTNFVAALEEKRFVFGIGRADRRRHMLIVGRSGVGKSKLLELLIRQDIAYGYGLCLIDPYGDLVREILDFIPEERMGDVVLVDPADSKFPPSFNPLREVPVEFRHHLTGGLIEVMGKLIGAGWTAHLEHTFRFMCLALLAYPGATLASMTPFLRGEEYRANVLKASADEMVRHFWQVEFPKWGKKLQGEVVTLLVNKLSQFLSNPFLGNILRQKENKINFEEIMRTHKILLISLAEEKLGAEDASFLGSLFLVKLREAAMARTFQPQSTRDDFYLYAEEFPAFLTPAFENFFTEARRFGISLTLATRYLFQLAHPAQASVFGACGTIIVFRLGAEDARRLEAELTPLFKARDMINLGMQEFYIKMTIDGNTSDPFSAETLDVLMPKSRSFREEIIGQARLNYATRLEGQDA